MLIIIPLCCCRIRQQRLNKTYIIRQPDGSVKLTLTPPAPKGCDTQLCIMALCLIIMVVLLIIVCLTSFGFVEYINAKPSVTVSDGNQICNILGYHRQTDVNGDEECWIDFIIENHECADVEYECDDVYKYENKVECIVVYPYCDISIVKQLRISVKPKYKNAFITFTVCVVMLAFAVLLPILLSIWRWHKNKAKRSTFKPLPSLQSGLDEYAMIESQANQASEASERRLKIGAYCYVDCESVYGVITGYLPNGYYTIIDLFENRERRAKQTSLTVIKDKKILSSVQKKYELYAQKPMTNK